MAVNDLDISNSKILIVDDEERNRRLLSKWLVEEGYECHSASSGRSALSLVLAIEPDLILLDLMMPGMDGFQVAAQLKENPVSNNIPIIMVTALTDKESMIRGLSFGAEEFLSKPVEANELQIRVRNMLRLKKASDQLRNQNVLLEDKVRERTRELKEGYLSTLEALGKAADYRDDETGAHVRRISYYSHALATRMRQDEEFCEMIFHASPLHDVGKIGTPDSILFKQGGLTDEEWGIMRNHTVVGAQILSTLHSPITDMGREIALNHHERWDGTGYPNGKAREQSPLPARIMSICDVYDALRSKRPYKEAFSHNKSMSIILEGDGRTLPKHFDPKVLYAIEHCADQFDEIFNRHVEESEV